MPSDVAFPYIPIGGASEKEKKRRICDMNRRNWKRIMLVSIVLLAVVISGFSAMTHAMAPQPATRAGGVLKIAMQQDLPNFNYFDLSSNTVWKSNVIGWNFESLMGMDYDGSAYPVLASKVDFDPNTLTATIHLRHNVTFQDGTPMTAKDVIFSYCALRQGTTVSGTSFTIPFDDNNDGTVSFDEIKHHVIYVDNYTIKITTRQPYSYFFLGTLGLPIIPEHIWKDHLVDSGDGQGTTVDAHGYTHGIVDTSWNSDPAATIGTGPWMYAGGVKDSYRIEKPYNGYWGKDFRSPDGYPFWNKNITEMMFKVYSNLDTAVLALQTGDVDYIAWSIQPGKVPILAKDPNIQMHYLADNGYFYLAFNEKQEPANYIAFRHAVSHVIDKKTAVQRYLGGFGRAGDSVEPPFFDAWYNASVQHYPYDINTAVNILDGKKVVADNGFVEQDPSWNEKFVDVNGDGWRDLPDGSPMPPITLFTPPADYDPVRIKVGQGIAQNLRSIGVNIQAKPVDFDTLVAYMQSYNYVMLELGWALSSDPIGNLADIYGPQSIQNTWGWWNASNPNPYYKNAGGVQNTRADKMSQDYATEFSKVINKAMTTFDVNEQIKYTKWAQDIIAKATVVNVLYYRLNVEATRKSWEGWVEWQGSVFNGLSLGMLHRTSQGGGGGVIPTPGQPYMQAYMNAPGKVLAGGTTGGYIYVMNSNGTPLKNAHVTLKSQQGALTLQPASGTTNSNGIFKFNITGGSAAATDIIDAQVTYNNYPMVNLSATVMVVTPTAPALNIDVSAIDSNGNPLMSLSPGQSVTLLVHVTDQNGNGVQGATVSIDPSLIGFGTVDKTSSDTNATGYTTFVYTAMDQHNMTTKYKNMHAIGKLVFTAKKDGYAYSNTRILQLITYNNMKSLWHIYRVENVSQYAVSPTLGWNVTITVMSMGADGAPIANDSMQVMFSNATYIAGMYYMNGTPINIVNGTGLITTNASGEVQFNVSFLNNSLLTTAPIYIEFTNTSLANAVSDQLDILYYDGHSMPSTELYGGLIQISTPFRVESDSMAPVNVYLYNKDNQPAGTSSSVPLAVVLSGTTDGQLVDLLDMTNYMNWKNDPNTYNPWFDSAWYYTGIGIYTPYDNIATSGDFIGHANETPNPYDDGLSTFNETGVVPGELTNGSYTFYLLDSMSSYRDLKYDIYVVPYGDIYLYIADPSWSFYQFNITGMQVLHTQGVISRAMQIRLVDMTVDPSVIPGHQFTVSATVLNESNDPVVGATLKVYNNAKSWKALYPSVSGATDSDGNVVLTPTAPLSSSPSELDVFAAVQPTSAQYAVLESTQIITEPPQMFVNVTPMDNMVVLGGEAMVKVHVTDSSGAPVSGVTLSVNPSAGKAVSVSGGSDISTDANGNAVFYIDTSGMSPSEMAGMIESINVAISAVKDGYVPGGAVTGVILFKGYPPTLSVGLANNAEITPDYMLVGYVYDRSNITTVVVSVDGGANANATVTYIGTTVMPDGSVYKEYRWTYELKGLSKGSHTIKVTAVNAREIQATDTITVQVTSGTGGGTTPTTPGGGAVLVGGMDLWLILTIILLIIVVIMGAMLARKPKAPVTEEMPPEEESEEPETPEEEEAPAEEETPEEGGEEE